MDKIRILIVEDEILIAEDLKDCLNAFGYHQIDLAHDAATAIKILAEHKIDLALLDVRMKGERDGIKIAEHIASTSQIPYIYITAHSDVEMVKEILLTKPAGYITKPIRKSDLFAAVSLIEDDLKAKTVSALKIKDGYSTILIQPENITYVESEGNYLNIFTTHKKYVARQSMDSLVSELNATLFYRIHRSYLVNVNHITRFSKKEVNVGGATIPVSRSASDDFEIFMAKRKT